MLFLIIIDSREKERIKEAVEYCDKNDICYEIRQLKSGDYVFERNKSVGFEYKNINDFISSIANGKIFRQVSNMDYDFNFVFISGFKDLQRAINKHNRFSKNKIYVNCVYSAIARLNTLCEGVIYIDCNTFDQEMSLMQSQAKKCFVMKDYNTVSDKKKGNNPAVTYLNCINGVSLQKAELICSTYNINCLTDLYSLTMLNITELDGIGKKTAEKIVKAINGDI